jgi:hypothetical protein
MKVKIPPERRGYLVSAPSQEILRGENALEYFDYLPYLKEGVQAKQVSSHDRGGGNIDGLLGIHSFLYKSNGEFVIFDEEGPGCVYRVWMTDPVSTPLNYALHTQLPDFWITQHIRFYFDDEEKPRIDMPLKDFLMVHIIHF